jgi:predicted nucleotide-binding protein
LNNKVLKVIKDLISEGEKLKSLAGNLFGTKRSILSDSEYTSWLQHSVYSIKKLGKSGQHLINDIENCPDIQFPYEHNVERILGNLQAALKIAEEQRPMKSQRNLKNKYSKKTKCNINKVFIIHGHNETAKQTVARFIVHLGLTPIILHEEPNKGRTLIEKVLDHSEDVNFAIALLTSDDVGYSKKNKKQENRARQNVIFEMGLFIGILGRQKVAALLEEKVKPPSDFDGVAYIPFDNTDGWKLKLAKELKEVFKFLDLNNIR